jgi:hypothetical protein
VKIREVQNSRLVFSKGKPLAIPSYAKAMFFSPGDDGRKNDTLDHAKYNQAVKSIDTQLPQ